MKIILLVLISAFSLVQLDASAQAKKLKVFILADREYLFIEAGGFSDKNPAGWKSPLLVMKRAGK